MFIPNDRRRMRKAVRAQVIPVDPVAGDPGERIRNPRAHEEGPLHHPLRRDCESAKVPLQLLHERAYERHARLPSRRPSARRIQWK